MKWTQLGAAACLVAMVTFVRGDAKAGLYWQQGVRSSSVSVCFVGDAVTSRPERVAQVLRYIREFSYASNVTFSAVAVTCAAPSSRSDGSDEYAGDIRVLLPFTSAPWTGAVPGAGCRSFRDAAGNYNGGNDGGGSWSNAPQDLATNRSCLYNLKLGDDGAGGVPYLNHALHEFGHALGLRHEHERNDVDLTLGSPSRVSAAMAPASSLATTAAPSCTTCSHHAGSTGTTIRLGCRTLIACRYTSSILKRPQSLSSSAARSYRAIVGLRWKRHGAFAAPTLAQQ